MLTPRFAIDVTGKYLVSRSPFLFSEIDGDRANFLKFFCAVLNSSVVHWYLRRHTFKYSRGYSRIEVNTLKNLPVPDPAEVAPKILRRILDLVDHALNVGPDPKIERQIDETVLDLYDFTADERTEIRGDSVGS